MLTSHSHIYMQLFLRDAEQIDGTTGSQEAYLSNDDLGVSAVASDGWHGADQREAQLAMHRDWTILCVALNDWTILWP